MWISKKKFIKLDKRLANLENRSQGQLSEHISDIGRVADLHGKKIQEPSEELFLKEEYTQFHESMDLYCDNKECFIMNRAMEIFIQSSDENTKLIALELLMKVGRL